MINNFDMSNQGVNLELSCLYDYDLARIWFEDCLKPRSQHEKQYLYVGADLDSVDPEDIAEYNYNRGSLLALLSACGVDREEFRNCCECNPEDADNDQLIEYFDTIKQYDDFTDELIDYLDPKFDVLLVFGSCQGDVATIYLPHDYWEKTGREKTAEALEEMREYLTNILYYQPIHCSLTIDGNEWDLMAGITDLYVWDSEKVLENFKNCFTHAKQKYIFEWLADNLPEYPTSY